MRPSPHTCAVWVLLLLVGAQASPYDRPQAGRALHARATAVAVSTGGVSTAESKAKDDAEVLTAALATGNGVATVAASGAGNETVQQVVVSDGQTTASTTAGRAPSTSAGMDGVPTPAGDNATTPTSADTPTPPPAAAGSSAGPLADYRTSLAACAGVLNVHNAVVDGKGWVWGWDNQTKTSCLYHHLTVTAAADPSTAPSCYGVPTEDTLRSEDGEMLFGQEADTWCVHRPLAAGDQAHDNLAPNIVRLPTDVNPPRQARKLLQKTKKASPTVSYEEAAACSDTPSDANSAVDSEGHLWGWENSTTCAFKDADGTPKYYVGFEPADWVLARPCAAAPFLTNAIMTSSYHVWAWEDGKLCAYKDDELLPISSDGTYKRLAWQDAPACGHEPSATTSSTDLRGRLWGFELERNCAFKGDQGQPLYYTDYTGPRWNAATGQADSPVPYSGYRYVDSTQATPAADISIAPVVEEASFGAASMGDDNSTAAGEVPTVVATPVGLIGQKSPDVDPSDMVWSTDDLAANTSDAVPQQADAMAGDDSTVEHVVMVPVVVETPVGAIGQKASDAGENAPWDVQANSTLPAGGGARQLQWQPDNTTQAFDPLPGVNFTGGKDTVVVTTVPVSTTVTNPPGTFVASSRADGGAGGVTPPSTAGSGTAIVKVPIYPEGLLMIASAPDLVISENEVPTIERPPVSDSLVGAEAFESGPGGLTLPNTQGMVNAGVAMVIPAPGFSAASLDQPVLLPMADSGPGGLTPPSTRR